MEETLLKGLEESGVVSFVLTRERVKGVKEYG